MAIHIVEVDSSRREGLSEGQKDGATISSAALDGRAVERAGGGRRTRIPRRRWDNGSHAETNSAAAWRASTGSVVSAESVTAAVAAAVIHRGTFRSIPSGPRTVIGSAVHRGAMTSQHHPHESV